MPKQRIADHQADHDTDHRRQCEFIIHRHFENDHDAGYGRADHGAGHRRHAADGKRHRNPGTNCTGPRHHCNKAAGHSPGSRANKQRRREHPAKQAKPYAERRQAELGCQQHSKEHRAIATIKDDRQRTAAKTQRLGNEHAGHPGNNSRHHRKAQD